MGLHVGCHHHRAPSRSTVTPHGHRASRLVSTATPIAQINPSNSRAIAVTTLRLILAAREKPLEASMQAMLGLPRDLEDTRTEAGLPLPELVAHGRPPAIGPGGFDDDATQMRIAGLGNAAGATALARGVLARNQAAVTHQLGLASAGICLPTSATIVTAAISATPAALASAAITVFIRGGAVARRP